MSGKKGQATVYTDVLGIKICDGLAEGRTLRAVCAAEGMPSPQTILSWAKDLDHPFAEHYAHARELGYQRMADDLVDIADGKSVAWTEADARSEDEASDRDPPKDVVQRDRLRVDTRKWLLSKALPKIYGDKIEVGGKDGGPIQHAVAVTKIERVIVDPADTDRKGVPTASE